MHPRFIRDFTVHLFPSLYNSSWCWLKEILDTTFLLIMNNTSIKVFRKDLVWIQNFKWANTQDSNYCGELTFCSGGNSLPWCVSVFYSHQNELSSSIAPHLCQHLHLSLWLLATLIITSHYCFNFQSPNEITLGIISYVCLPPVYYL